MMLIVVHHYAQKIPCSILRKLKKFIDFNQPEQTKNYHLDIFMGNKYYTTLTDKDKEYFFCYSRNVNSGWFDKFCLTKINSRTNNKTKRFKEQPNKPRKIIINMIIIRREYNNEICLLHHHHIM